MPHLENPRGSTAFTVHKTLSSLEDHAFDEEARVIDAHSLNQHKHQQSLNLSPLRSFQGTMKLEAPIYCAATVIIDLTS
jgi:hypothetical protein